MNSTASGMVVLDGVVDALREPIEEQAPVRQPGELIRQSEPNALARVGVEQRDASVLGEDLEHLAFGLGERPRPPRADRQAADRDTVRTDRNGHRRPQALVDERRCGVRRCRRSSRRRRCDSRGTPARRCRSPCSTRVGGARRRRSPWDAARTSRLGSDGSRSRRHTTVSPKSCVVPSTIATSTSSSGARREIELWIRTSRERNCWRSWSSLRNARLCWSSCSWVSRFDRRRSSWVRLRKQTTTPLMPGTPRRLVRSASTGRHPSPSRTRSRSVPRPSSSPAISANRLGHVLGVVGMHHVQ